MCEYSPSINSEINILVRIYIFNLNLSDKNELNINIFITNKCFVDDYSRWPIKFYTDL